MPVNAAIIAAIVAAQRNTSLKPNNTLSQIGSRNNTESVATWFLLQKGNNITMKIAFSETIISTIMRGYHCTRGYEYAATINGQKITASTVEDCLQKVIETTHAKEIQLIPHSIDSSTINSYLLLLKVNKEI